MWHMILGLLLLAGAHQAMSSQDRQQIGQLFSLPKSASALEGLPAIVSQEDVILTQLIAGWHAVPISENQGHRRQTVCPCAWQAPPWVCETQTHLI